MFPYFYRLTFQKRERAAFLSNTELLQDLRRYLARAGLPLHTSGGGQWPSIKLSSFHSLPTGVESRKELTVFGLTQFLFPSEIYSRLLDTFPRSLQPQAVTPRKNKKGLSIEAIDFRVDFQAQLPADLRDNASKPSSKNEKSARKTLAENCSITLQNIQFNSIQYRTGFDQGICHPDRLIEALHCQFSPSSIPAVSRFIKMDVQLND